LVALDKNGNKSLSKLVFITPNQIRWAVREEMAIQIEDVLSRRTRALFLNAKESLLIAPKVAKIMADEMGKNTKWIKDQLKNYTTLTKNYIIT